MDTPWFQAQNIVTNGLCELSGVIRKRRSGFRRSELQAMVTHLSSGIVDPEELQVLARVLEKARETLAVEKGSAEHEALAITLVQLTHRLSDEKALLAELIRSSKEAAA